MKPKKIHNPRTFWVGESDCLEARHLLLSYKVRGLLPFIAREFIFSIIGKAHPKVKNSVSPVSFQLVKDGVAERVRIICMAIVSFFSVC